MFFITSFREPPDSLNHLNYLFASLKYKHYNFDININTKSEGESVKEKWSVFYPFFQNGYSERELIAGWKHGFKKYFKT